MELEKLESFIAFGSSRIVGLEKSGYGVLAYRLWRAVLIDFDHG